MDNALVSLIISAYNADKYLKRCLESVVNQTYKNLEIILVDDGSVDDSGRICDIYAAQDCRIHVIHQQNAGISVARNNALAVATGEYLGFTDADDKLEADYIETLLRNIAGYDMVVCGFHSIDKDGNIVDRSLPKNCIMTTGEFLEVYLDDEIAVFQGLEIGPKIGGYLWNKLFRRQVWGDIKFIPQIREMEDTLAVARYLSKINKINCIIDCKYFYYQIIGSATNQIELNVHSGDMIVARKMHRDLVRLFLQKRQVENKIIIIQSDVIVLLAYVTVFKKYARFREENSIDCQQYVQDFKKEFCVHYSCLRLCKNKYTSLKLWLCYLMPGAYFRMWRLKNFFSNRGVK